MFMPKILESMLQGMYRSIIAPGLWNSILQTFGFYTNNLSFSMKAVENSDQKEIIYHSSVIDFDYDKFDQVLRTYTERQTILTSKEVISELFTFILFTKLYVSDF